ncbi:hypothetical protein [Laribacter hongkongensis]|uniref:Uncharacterized protein n=1 Tax=Laribacter hongkongensis TaxID=168471 RepID=A0ABD4STB6_9NEIS|nr:hypothetical protein [Laribacter hongkongensis]MCG9026501.1 hypothetical protein [Laribacter hongkongensis]
MNPNNIEALALKGMLAELPEDDRKAVHAAKAELEAVIARHTDGHGLLAVVLLCMELQGNA